MIDVGRPRPVQGYQPPRVDRPAEHVFWQKLALVPGDNLLQLGRYTMVVPSFADIPEPFMVRIVCATAVVEPLFDEHIGAIVIEGGIDEL